MPREIYQSNSLIVNSEPYPSAQVEVYNGGSMRCRKVYSNIYSSTEFVMVVITVDGSQLTLYKNGVSQSSESCAYKMGATSDILYIGRNHFGGTVKSFAYWDRTLTASEISALQTTGMNC